MDNKIFWQWGIHIADPNSLIFSCFKMQQQQNKNVFETHASAAAERCLSSTLDSCSAWFGYMLESCPE